MRISSAFVTAAIFACTFATSTVTQAQAKPGAAKGAAKKEAEPPPLPPAQARMWLIAPTVTGPWTLRIENEGSVAVRIPADGRLLRLEVHADEAKKPVSCTLPKSLRPSGFPEDRALLLAPGQSYVESFDPLLFCFGKNAAALGPNATVRSRFGWDPPKQKSKPKKPPTGPFAVESTEREATIAPLWELQAPAILLGPAAAPIAADTKPLPKDADSDTKPAPVDAETEAKPDSQEGAADSPKAAAPANAVPVDERAGRLELSSTGFVEASAPRTITVTVTAKNAGMRPIMVALRPWMLSFRIDGPQGEPQMCYGDNSRRVLPRDAFRKLAAGASTSFSVLLAEVCPRKLFTKPGLYRVTASIAAQEMSSGTDVQTTELSARQPTLVRLATADDPFYSEPPKAVSPAPVEAPGD
ncbi:MAG: hypothetical protein IPM54_34775 [Polyangiaceae bacterium]|nr:hypothetical protein [Polyangiaceae bacterium]